MLSQEHVPAARAGLQNFNEELGVYINENDRYKLGKVLTIVDATISNPEQCKAIKDLINSAWWGNDNRISGGAMSNPHTDLRAVAKALGFELYEKSDAMPAVHNMEDFAVSRYEKIAAQK